MKFLVRSEIPLGIPAARLAALLERTRTHVRPPDGPVGVECLYGVLGGRGAIAICDAPDAEALNAVLSDAPLFNFEHFTITPLVSFDAFVDGMTKAATAAATLEN